MVTFLRPGSPAYAAELVTDNRSVTHRPAVVVAARTEADVVAAVRTARERGLRVAVQATGHGMAAASDGVLVSTRRLDHVEVDPVARTVRVGAGARWRQVLDAVAPHGLAPLNGSAPGVGVAGYVLGGGVGMLGRQHGYAADHVRRVRLVTADGELRDVTAETEPELFWAVRGSKGHLGIATELELDLFEVAPLVGGGVYVDGAAAADLLGAWSAWIPGVPREVATSVLLVGFPDVDGVPAELRGRRVAHLRVAAFGVPDTDALLAPLRAAGPVLLDTVGPLPYADIGTIHHEPAGVPYEVHETGLFTGPLDADHVEALVEASEDLLVEVRHHGGAYADVPAVANPVGGRDATHTVYLSGPPEVPPARYAAVRSRLDDRGSVLNFLGAGTPPEDVRSAFSAEEWAGLQAAARTWDPDRVLGSGLPRAQTTRGQTLPHGSTS